MILYKNLAVVAFSVLMVNRSPLLEKFIVPDKRIKAAKRDLASNFSILLLAI